MYTPRGSVVKALSTPKARTFSFSQQDVNDDKNSSHSDEDTQTLNRVFQELDEQLDQASETN